MHHVPVESRKSILIVDDEKEIRELLETLIYKEFGTDIRVVESSNGVDALCKINFQKFDCIITDIVMPKKDGKSFIKTVRQNTYNDMTPIIVISGSATSTIESEFPFVYFVAKPFDFSTLGGLIERLVLEGSNENKISASALNLVLQSVQNIMKSQLDSGDVNVGKPMHMGGDFSYADKMTSRLKLSVGKIDNQISYFVSQASLQGLYKDIKDLEKSNGLLAQKIAEELGESKHLIQAVNVISSGWSKEMLSKKKQEGILIPISCGDVEIELFAKVG